MLAGRRTETWSAIWQSHPYFGTLRWNRGSWTSIALGGGGIYRECTHTPEADDLRKAANPQTLSGWTWEDWVKVPEVCVGVAVLLVTSVPPGDQVVRPTCPAELMGAGMGSVVPVLASFGMRPVPGGTMDSSIEWIWGLVPGSP